MAQHGKSDRHMDMSNQMSNMRDMYRDNHNMASNMMNHNMLGQDMSRNMLGQEIRSNMRDMHRQNPAFGLNQYFVKDDLGNYVYSYKDQQSEKSEEGNNHFTRGKYAYIMSNGVKRKVEYIADDNGFHIIKDNADPARIKRSSEPDLFQTQLTSVMDSTSLKDDTHDKQTMSSMMGQDMFNMDRNMMGRDRQMYSKMMMGMNKRGQESMGRNMIVQDNMERNMIQKDSMGRNIYSIMSNRGKNSDMSNMMNNNMIGKQMNSNMMGLDMTMGRNMMIGQDRNSKVMGRNMLSHQDIIPNMMYSMMSQDRHNNQMSSNMMNLRSNDGLMGQRMMQQMEMEHTPETFTSTFF